MKNVITTRTVPGNGVPGKLCVLALAGLLGMAPFAAMADLSGNIGAASNYVFRGVSLSGNGAAVSGGVDYSHSSGLYAGTWISNITGAYEWDIYGGYSNSYKDVTYDVGYLHYTYPSLTNADYGEVYGSLSYKWFTAGVAYTVNTDVQRTAAGAELFIPGDVYYYAKASYDLGHDWSLGGTIGYYDFKDDGVAGAKASYTHGQIDLTKSAGDYGDFTLTLSLASKASYSGASGHVIPIVSWSKSF